MIIYFSATGNCKFVAREIAKELADEAVSILDIKDGISLHTGERLGLVFPTYYWGLPTIVNDFLDKVQIRDAGQAYIYFVATYGTTSGQTGIFVQRHLQKKGLKLTASFSVKMPDRWTPTYDLSDSEKVSAINNAELPQIRSILGHIRKGDSGDYMKAKVPMLAVKLFNPLYENARKTAHFNVENQCPGCGLCARRCPAKAIDIIDGKPAWVKNQCVMCLGCLHHCPEFAIQYGKNTKKHGQYVHP